MTNMNIGIVSYGLHFPKDFETAEDVAAKAGLTLPEVMALGIKRKCLPSQKDQPVSMAVKAAEDALLLDTSEMSIEEVVARIQDHVKQRQPLADEGEV